MKPHRAHNRLGDGRPAQAMAQMPGRLVQRQLIRMINFRKMGEILLEDGDGIFDIVDSQRRIQPDNERADPKLCWRGHKRESEKDHRIKKKVMVAA